MTELIFANNASTTTSGSITATSTTVNVSVGTGALFPHPLGDQQFIATFIDQLTGNIREIVHVTNVTLDTITIVRAQEGTTAQAWPAGSIFAHLHTAGAMQSFLQKVDILATSIIYSGVDTGPVNTIVVRSTEPPLSQLIPDTLLNITIETNNDSSDVNMIVAPDTAVYPVYRADGHTLQPNDISFEQKALFTFTGTSFQLTNYKPQLLEKIHYPLDYWAGFFTGLPGTPPTTPDQWIAHVTAPVPYPYPAGLIISGLTTFSNTGPIEISVNNGEYVPVIQMDGTPFQGPIPANPGATPPTLAVPPEFHNDHTMVVLESDGNNFRAHGYTWLGTGGGGSGTGGGGGGTPPPVVPPPIFVYGEDQSVYIEINSSTLPLPTAEFISSTNILSQPKSAYGLEWLGVGVLTVPYWAVINPPSQANANRFDNVVISLFQRGSLFGPGFKSGDPGTLWATVTGAGSLPPGFEGSGDLGGTPPTGTVQGLASLGVPVGQAGAVGGTSDNYGVINFEQAVGPGFTYGDVGSIYITVTLRGSVIPQVPHCSSANTRTMASYGGNWIRLGTLTINPYGTSNYWGVPPANYGISFFQRIS
jgi:hypothetical protein